MFLLFCIVYIGNSQKKKKSNQKNLCKDKCNFKSSENKPES